MLLIGGIGVVDLRLTGAFRSLPLNGLSNALTPLALAGLCLMIGSGAVMFAADAKALIGSPAFRWKLVFIAVALLNAIAFRYFSRGKLQTWNRQIPYAARMAAITSLAAWLLVAAFGRMIAYV